MPLIPIIGRQRQAAIHEFEAIGMGLKVRINSSVVSVVGRGEYSTFWSSIEHYLSIAGIKHTMSKAIYKRKN